MQRFTLVLVLASWAVSGCCGPGTGCVGKRETELISPTDVRKSHFWCWGEDAIFHYPSGPDGEFYGHRPTCWRAWPAGGAEWRDGHCGWPVEMGFPPTFDVQDLDPCAPTMPPDESLPMPHDYGPTISPEPVPANPFREDASAGGLMLPPETRPRARMSVSPPFATGGTNMSISGNPGLVTPRPPDFARADSHSGEQVPVRRHPSTTPTRAASNNFAAIPVPASRAQGTTTMAPALRPVPKPVANRTAATVTNPDALPKWLGSPPRRLQQVKHTPPPKGSREDETLTALRRAVTYGADGAHTR